ncbi:MAG: BlaI/MecI/CopY family transcriptional regulator [Zestosphaera sp.]
MKYVKTSKHEIIRAVRKTIYNKLRSSSGNSITITVKKVIEVLELDNHAVRTEVGRVLARLEELGYLRRHNSGRPAKYLITSKGLKWVKEERARVLDRVLRRLSTRT